MTEKMELKPCPHCGSKRSQYSPRDCDEWAITCANCGAQGPNELNSKDAKYSWNLRRPEDALTAELAALREERRWIPVSERLPKDGVDVLVVNNFSDLVTVGRHSASVPQWETLYGYFYHGDLYGEITHWMPLPNAPEEQ